MKKLLIILFSVFTLSLFTGCYIDIEPEQTSVLIRNKSNKPVIMKIIGQDFEKSYNFSINQEIEVSELWTNQEYEVVIYYGINKYYCEDKLKPSYSVEKYRLEYSDYKQFYIMKSY